MVHQSIMEHKHCLCARPPPSHFLLRAGLMVKQWVCTCEGVPLSASLMCAAPSLDTATCIPNRKSLLSPEAGEASSRSVLSWDDSKAHTL